MRTSSGCKLAIFCLVMSPLFLEPNLSAADVPPRVLGYERIYSATNADGKAAGQLLLGELNCTACHVAAEAAALQIQRKAAPVLDSVGSRVKPEYLRRFLGDPQATKPGTTMPNIVPGSTATERAEIVEALVHFLASTGTIASSNPSRLAANRGEALFHAIGCVACHDPRSEQPMESVAASIPLGKPSDKYTLSGLTQFLEDPLAVRPGGRMPDLNLTAAEARDIASFLLNDLDMVAGLDYAYYEGEWEKLPKFEALTAIATGEAENFDLAPARRKDHFALRFEGTIQLPQAGDYLFLIGSDDGSRLFIDGKVVVVADGVHPFEQKRRKQPMTAGPHEVVVEYFEDEGEEALQVDFEGPGMTQQPLATLLTSPTRQPSSTNPPDGFSVDAKKAAKGREYFASLGCASCHVLREQGTQIESTKKSKPLAELGGRGGCLDRQAGSTPRYGLSESQTAALSEAITTLKAWPGELTASESVDRTLVRFNCIACHQRGDLGGVLAARDSFFVSDMPEMGDEGRIPPSLDGVGAKLTKDWLHHIFTHGAKDRPYMLTRMPKFGAANVGHLTAALTAADQALIKSAPVANVTPEEERRVKAAGRRLVGAQGFSCIKCHTFADQRSSGIQALSLTTMTKRLRRDWFYHYLQNPLTYRPGTRMPTAFPDGQTTLPKVLDGKVDTQVDAIWRYLSDGDKAVFPVGLITGKIEIVAYDEPVIYRNFIEGAGTRAIGVGYPEKLNLAFDANNMRLALLWHGAFIDAARHWTARGAGFEKPLGDNVLRLPDGPPLAVLKDRQAAWPSAASAEESLLFHGYRLGLKRQPIFLYSWNGLTIEDWPRPVGQDDLFTMQRTLTFTGLKPMENSYFRAARASQLEKLAEITYRIDNRWTLRVTSESDPTLRDIDGERELLIPIVFANGKATIELNYDW